MRREISAWLAALALILNFLAEGALEARPIEIDPTLSAIAGDTFVICTPGGKLEIGQGGRPASDPSDGHAGHDGPNCVFCLPLLHGALLAPPLAEPEFVPNPPRAIRRHVADPGATSLFRASGHWARAPPLL